MAVKVPSFDELMWPALQALKQMDGSASNEELLQKVIEVGGYPTDVQNYMHSDHRQTKLSYNLAWAKTYLKREGALDNSQRGVWSITAKGEALTEGEVKEIPAKVRKEIYEARKAASSAEIHEDEEPDQDHWKTTLLSVLTKMAPDAFERLSQRILRESGFIKVLVTGRSGDGGIDGLGVLRVALLSFQVSFQCKRYKGSIGPAIIRDFRGAMIGRSDKGLLITTGTFTAEAQKEATRDGAPAIDLIDGDSLCELLKTLKLGVATEMVESVSVKPEFFEMFKVG